jgi:hypothetical protein
MLKVLLITNLVIYSSIYITIRHFSFFGKITITYFRNVFLVKTGTVKVNYCEEKVRLVSSR